MGNQCTWEAVIPLSDMCHAEIQKEIKKLMVSTYEVQCRPAWCEAVVELQSDPPTEGRSPRRESRSVVRRTLAFVFTCIKGKFLRSWEKKTMGSQRQCYSQTQPGAAHTHIIIRGRFFVAQESNLEVCADKPPVDSTLTGIFLDTLQDCVGFTQQLLTWWKPKQCVLRVLRQAVQASPALFLHRQTQATTQHRGAAKPRGRQRRVGPVEKWNCNDSDTASHGALLSSHCE